MRIARVLALLGGIFFGPGAAQAAAPAGISVQNPWFRYLLPADPAGGYMVLRNAGDAPAMLTGASSPACATLDLHQSMDSGGMAMMMAVNSLSVPPHGSLSFAPGSYHLMCMAPKMTVGQNVPVTLRFMDGTFLVVNTPVYGPAGAP